LRWIEIHPGKGDKDPPVLLVRFIGIADVGIEAQNMTNMVGYLYLHRIAWLRVLPLGKLIRDHKIAVITKIAIREIKK
jgi:hypothetical protein